jgi:hypothetical protein
MINRSEGAWKFLKGARGGVFVMSRIGLLSYLRKLMVFSKNSRVI